MYRKKWRAKNKKEAGLVLDQLALRGHVVLKALDEQQNENHTPRRRVTLEYLVSELLDNKSVDLVD